ncbi:MAG: hypothetical protein WCP20_16215 [Desulfuromonadales bacterium]
MLRKALLLSGLILVLPVFAIASWQLNTWVKSAGGTIVSRNKATPQMSTDGSVFVSYTTHASLPVTVNANTGYTISNVTVNGATAATSGTFYSALVAGPSGQSVSATFAAKLLSVTAAAGYGGAVDKASISSIYYGSKVYSATSFRFYPNPTTFRVSNITGVPAGATVSVGSFPAAFGASVSVTFPVNYVFTDNVTLKGTFSGPPIANAGVPQTVKPGNKITLDGSASTGTVIDSVVTEPVADYTWVQTTGPAVTLMSSGSNATFTPTVEDTYQFKLTVTGGSAATTTVYVSNSAVSVVRTSCQNCHQVMGVGSNKNVFGNWSSSTHAQQFVMCASCHVGADTGGHPGILSSGTVNESTFTYTLYTVGNNFCFTCHHKANNVHYNSEAQVVNICVACHNPDVHNPAATMSRALGDQHFNGYTSSVNPNYRAAYVTPNSRCSNCHITINGTLDVSNDPALLKERTDWASSGHGDTKGAGWIASNFKTLSGCVQCHTPIGFIAYSTAKITGAWGTTSDKTSNVLSCDGCHTNIGTGAVRASNPIQPYANDPYVNPDLSVSNLCVKCHSGIESGRSIKAQSAASADFTNLAFIGSHSSAAAGILLKSVGYEFASNNYSNSRHFKHDRIGSNHFKAYGYDTGSGGPCVGCHMSTSNKHSFTPLLKDAHGVVTSITSTSCAGCHTGPAYLDASRMNVRGTKYAAALSALQKVLETRGIYYANVAPYFFRSSGNTDPANAITNWGNADTMGAAFNFNLLQHEPGAYAHNMIYTKRLIYDSIDFLDNGLLDNSVIPTINGLSGLDPAQKVTAVGYLTSSGARP